MTGTDPGSHRGFIRTVQGDRVGPDFGIVYAHEHLIIDSPLIAAAFPHIHLYDTDAAVEEVGACRRAGVGLMLDAMPCAAGRDAARLATIADRSGVEIVAATGLHHDRYYGPLHWTNRVDIDELVELFVGDLTEGIDVFDYTGPVVRRTDHRAGIVKVATSGRMPDPRDLRNLEAAARASVLTGAPILTHCENGAGALAQVDRLTSWGVPAASILLSHVDKAGDLPYLLEIAASGAVLEFDQALRNAADGASGFTATAIAELVGAGFGDQLVVGTDGARRTLWESLGGKPGLAWLAAEFPRLLRTVGLADREIGRVLRHNAVAALTWRPAAG